MSSSGSERGISDEFDAQLEEINIDNLKSKRDYRRRKSTDNESNFVSPRAYHRRASSVNEPPELASPTDQEE